MFLTSILLFRSAFCLSLLSLSLSYSSSAPFPCISDLCYLFFSILLIYISLLLCYLLIYFPYFFYKFLISLSILSLYFLFKLNSLSLLLHSKTCSVVSFYELHIWHLFFKPVLSALSFQLPHMQSDFNFIFNCSTIDFFYLFLSFPLGMFCCSIFCSSFYLFNHSLFYLVIISPSLIFSMLIFSCLFFYLSQSSKFLFSVKLLCRKCCYNSHFPVFLSYFCFLVLHCYSLC